MKDEFNLRRLDLKDFAQVAAFLMPACILTVQQYGWSGLLVAVTAIAGLNALVTPFRAKEHHEHAFMNTLDLRPKTEEDRLTQLRVQKITDAVAARYKMGPVPVIIIGEDRKAAASKTRIFIHREFCANAQDNEIETLMAHELDHVRQRDTYLSLPFLLAEIGSVGAIIVTLCSLKMFHDQTALQPEAGVGRYMDYGVALAFNTASFVSVLWASKKLQRCVENRCDENSGIITGKPDKLISALQKSVVGRERILEKPNMFFDLFRSHPPHEQRFKRLRALRARLATANPIANPPVSVLT